MEQKETVQTPINSGVEASKKSFIKKPWFWIIIAVIILSTIITFAVTKKGGFEWPSSGIATVIPNPQAKKGKIIINDEDHFLATVNSYNEDEYNSYLENCKKYGFTIDADSSSGYDAYNKDGYKISLFYISSKEDLSIEVEAPMEYEEIVWPEIGAGSMLPQPKSDIGKITSDTEDTFIAYISNTDKKDFTEYIKACQKAGFNTDYNKGDDYYYADNKDGYHLSLNYEGNQIMFVKIEKSSLSEDNETTTVTTTQKQTTTVKQSTKKQSSSAVTPKFKELMDSYEAFIDEYVSFMKKYNKSGQSTEMLSDYLDYLQKYNDFVKKVDDIDEENLSTADALYYAEVNARVAKKLAQVS